MQLEVISFPAEELLPQKERYAEADRHRAELAPHVQSLLALRGDTLVWEQYWGGYELDIIWPVEGSGGEVELGDPYPASHDRRELHNLKSCTKSVMATIVGIAVGRGDLPGIDTPVCELLPAYFEGVDARKRAITLRHLLAMRSGLAWEENGQPTLDWLHADDLVGFTLTNLDLRAEPGSAWCYSTADSHLLSACLAASSGMSTLEYARIHLFQPLGIGEHRWSADPQGRHIGGSELFLTSRDMLRFGRLARRRGQWNGEQVVDEHWMEQCVAPQEGVTHDFLLADGTPPGMAWPQDVRFYPEGYGYQWWRTTIDGHASFLAEGLGGQMILVVDDLDLVVAMTATTDLGPPDSFPGAMAAQFELIEQHVIPSLS